MRGIELDEIDRQILDLLRADARRTVADIARRVSLSAAPVRRRIDRLEAIGVITGYTVVVDDAKLGLHLAAFVELKFAGNASIEEISSVLDTLSEVRALFMTAGDPDALVWLSVEDLSDLRRIVSHLRRSKQVTGTKTLMVLDTWAPSRPPHASS
ncbi:MAG: Lrp/AsnC family transcriptional regulator [Conexibacter sp.]|jgi:DNA-binding Lrp family transcriptional regulator|nr:Lrp/AsnC family transcriptional regulator [Conexibacter sp.]